MSSVLAAEPTPWLDRARALTPLLIEHRRAAEQSYRMAPPVRKAVGEASLFRMPVPLDATIGPPTILDAVAVHEELAFADPSVAWAASNSLGATLMLSRLPPSVQAEILAPSTTFVGAGLPPTGRAERRDGGLWVTGSWPVVSGSADADWFMLHCTGEAAGAPGSAGTILDARFVAVPASAVTVSDTWRGVMAVQGSGSNAISVEGCLVPSERAIALFGSETDGAIDQLSARSPFALTSLALAAVAVGIGRAALEAAVEQASTRRSIVSHAYWSEWPGVQDTAASATLAVRAARTTLFEVTAQIEAEVNAGTLLPTTVAQAHAMADHAFRTMRHSVSDLYTIGSVDVLRAGNRLEQSLRDLHGHSVNWERYRRLQFAAGRALLGAPANDPLF